ncbi:unnamed protein product [Rodentolepis nana]|uniref:Uncharacterized protein n=1 Tax=Rodentolepis nana TaxID=102285 RepID=A0A0R3U079_RODNA|nr:unnamed protein product [Rodentolepis nana]
MKCKGKEIKANLAMRSDISEANFYLSPQPSNGGFVYEDAMGFQTGPFCSPRGTAPLLTEVTSVSGNEATPQSTQFLTANTTTAIPDGVIRLACLPAKQSHTLARCNFIGQKKLIA